jgi:hypothetical protein
MAAIACCSSSTVAVSEHCASTKTKASEYTWQAMAAKERRRQYRHKEKGSTALVKSDWQEWEARHGEERREGQHGLMRRRSFSYDDVLKVFLVKRPEKNQVEPDTTDRVGHPEPSDYSDTYLKVNAIAQEDMAGAQEGSKEFAPRRKHRRQPEPMAPPSSAPCTDDVYLVRSSQVPDHHLDHKAQLHGADSGLPGQVDLLGRFAPRGRYQPPNVTKDEEPQSVTVTTVFPGPLLASRPLFPCSLLYYQELELVLSA